MVPVLPTDSVIIPVHSPQYEYFESQQPELPELPLHERQATSGYDPSVVLPLEHRNRVSVALVNQPFRTLPKVRQHSHARDKRHASRTSRRRQLTQLPSPEASGSTVRHGNLASSSTGRPPSGTFHATDASNWTPTQHPTLVNGASTSRHQKSKRQSEADEDDVDSESRPWKSPRGAVDEGKKTLHERQGLPRTAAMPSAQEAHESAKPLRSSRARASRREEDVQSGDPVFIAALSPLPIE